MDICVCALIFSWCISGWAELSMDFPVSFNERPWQKGPAFMPKKLGGGVTFSAEWVKYVTDHS